MRELHIIAVQSKGYQVHKHYSDLATACHTIIMSGTTRYNNMEVFTLCVEDGSVSEEGLEDIAALYDDYLIEHLAEISADAHPIVLSAVDQQLAKHRESLNSMIKTAKGF